MKTSSLNEVGTQAIIQARSGSTRLPGKIFEKIGEKSALEWVVERLKKTTGVERIVIATTLLPKDDNVEKFAAYEGVSLFRGSEEDVLDRFVKAIEKFPAKVIVRATSDNPLLDAQALDTMIGEHIKQKADHTTVWGPVPIGSAAEVVSASALRKAWENTGGGVKAYREHVTPYIYEKEGRFRVIKISPPEYLKGKSYRFTLDTKDDLDLLRTIHKRLDEDNKPFNAKNATRLVDQEPGVVEINRLTQMKDWREGT